MMYKTQKVVEHTVYHTYNFIHPLTLEGKKEYFIIHNKKNMHFVLKALQYIFQHLG